METTRFRLPLWLCYLAGLRFAPVLTVEAQMPPTSDYSSTEIEEPQVVIRGPDYVTVGVPCSFECVADCPSFSCTYSMSLDHHSAQGQGNAIAFTVQRWMEALTVTCSVSDDQTGFSGTVTKKLQVLAGPANVSILGSDLMYAKDHTYSCQAYCHPSCSYSWRVDDGPWVKGSGNAITVHPQEMDTLKTITCKAANLVSHLFASATRNIQVVSGPTDVQISGPDQIHVWEESKFVCSAQCSPSCRYSWVINDHTVRGREIEVTLERPVASLAIRCEAQNTVSKKSGMAVRTVLRTPGASGPSTSSSIASRLEKTSDLLFCAFVLSAVISL